MTQPNNGMERVAARFSVRGRRALVTGGSLSIGRAITRALADAGAAVAINYASEVDADFGHPEAAESLLAEIRDAGGHAALVGGDLSRAGVGVGVVEAAVTALGGIDILVICASRQQRTPFLELASLEIEQQFQINFRATIDLLQGALPGMTKRGWGRVVSVGSINARRPEADLSVYAALKSAQHNLIVNLARQVAAQGVTVNTISPGLIATERNRWRRDDVVGWNAIQAKSNPMGCAGAPEDIGGVALLLCSEAGRFITGADVPVDGGHGL
jgi:NAD(P)-dependent dehydrogenase (short-subunit alcohol dehydrogenase family)